MLHFQTLHHVAIPVTDLERAKAFYGGVLGLQKMSRPPFPFDGAWYRVGDREIHLIVSEGQTFRGDEAINTRDVHFALRVASFSQAVAYFRSKGFSETSGDPHRAMRVSPDSVAGFPQIYIVDPDRNVIEVNAEKLDGTLPPQEA